MKSAPVLFVVFLSIICVSHCKDLIMGSSFNNVLIYQQKVKYSAIPFTEQVNEVFFSDPGQQIIKGIILRDLDHTGAIPSVTAGGVEYSYVNIRIRGGRASGLHYNLSILA